ncbi:uncharacterized protein PAC_17508 [Phialocephala subalpina]|uniref:Histone chaperone domain-containing protein n=1 Tax=Phialocephala subalpina TaxID=576137 RepID=A0A1L7XRH9_9HELO|nr:uncharacterized protein PAC_17508 [Phialocephala subalpina]
MSADDQYEQMNDQVSGDAPAGDSQDNNYVSRTGQKQGPIPVQSDNDIVEDPIDSNVADSDEQLARDDNEAIDQSNIVDGRTRGAKPSGGYREPGDEEGLPGPEDGTSSGAQ